MSVPGFTRAGLLPLGRFACSIDEFESCFVLDPQFSASNTRTEIFGDFLSAIGLVQEIKTGMIESIWVGGGFASSSLDPSDIDATFILSQDVYEALDSVASTRIKTMLKHDGFKTFGLKVDGFMCVRKKFANPWMPDSTVRENAQPDLSIRGAWDDWWSRHRVYGKPEERPKIEDAEPRRGYVEVMFDA